MNLSSQENSQEFFQKTVPLALRGDQDAISALYEATYNPVYHTVKSMVQDEDAVLDIVQDSYVKAFQSLDQLDAPENFRSWLKRIATNKTKDFFKKKRPVLFSEMAGEDDGEIDFQDDRRENLPEEVIDQQETTRLINEILDSLSQEQRLVIGMFYYEQMSIKEIAQILDCSENTVKSRLNYGRKKVEVQVRELEKQGTKLYSLAPIPFLLWLFHMDAKAAALPGPVPPVSNVLSALSDSPAGVPTSGAPAGNAPASGSAKAVRTAAKTASAGKKALALKITAGVLAAAVVAGGAAVAISFSQSGKHGSKSGPTEDVSAPTETVSTETVSTETVSTETAPTETAPTETASTETASTEDGSAMGGSYEQACQDMLELYKTAIQMDHDQWNNDPAIYERFPTMGDTMYYYHSGAYLDPHWFYALPDVDGDGTAEMFIGFAEGAGDLFICEAYAWNGSEMALLKNCQILQDGTILQFAPGNSGELIGVKQLENGVLTDKPDTGISLGFGPDNQALQAHGGFFRPEWFKLTE